MPEPIKQCPLEPRVDTPHFAFYTKKDVHPQNVLVQPREARGITMGKSLQEIFGYTPKSILLDPGVHALRTQTEFPQIAFFAPENVAKLPSNVYYSLDYPCDMQPSQCDLFKQKSWDEAKTRQDDPHAVITIQSKFGDIADFKRSFDKYIALNIKSGILGIGNMCRILNMPIGAEQCLPRPFVQQVLTYIRDNYRKHPNIKQIHFYGLSKYYMQDLCDTFRGEPVKVSVDNTKWTKPVTKELARRFHPEGLPVGHSYRTVEEMWAYYEEYLKGIIQDCKL